jgi:hypothetical protein
MKKLILIFFLASCSTNELSNKALDFNKDLSFNEFKELLKKYNSITAYPNIDK